MNALRGLRETFARFFEDPSRETLRNLLRENYGETENLDFKEQWPAHASLAKQILGMANTGPGCLVMGVGENSDKTLSPVGISEIKDKADVYNGLKKYLPSELLVRFHVHDFAYDASEYDKIVGKRFQVVQVDYSIDHLPFVCMKGSEQLRESAIYVRREGVTSEATHDELQRIINRRIEAAYSTSGELDLKKHLEQLRILYSEMPRHIGLFGDAPELQGIGALMRRANPASPREGLDAFMARMIDAKKAVIAKALGIPEEVMRAHKKAERLVADGNAH